MSERIDDGEPAFPVALPGMGDDGSHGMTLRVYLAAQILPAIIALKSDARIKGEVADAFLYADAMIEASKPPRE